MGRGRAHTSRAMGPGQPVPTAQSPGRPPPRRGHCTPALRECNREAEYLISPYFNGLSLN